MEYQPQCLAVAHVGGLLGPGQSQADGFFLEFSDVDACTVVSNGDIHFARLMESP